MNDIENLSFTFAQAVRNFIKSLPMTIANTEDIRELLKSSGSVGANYVHARASASKRDFQMGVKKSEQSAKVAQYWLRLIDTQGIPELDAQRSKLVAAADELAKVFVKVIKQTQ